MRRQLAFGLSILLFGSAGCTSCRYHAVSLYEPCEANDECHVTRQRVYAVLVNGNDVLGFGHFSKLHEELNRSGFPMVYSGEMYHAAAIERSVREVHSREPEARFVLIGYSYGSAVASDLAAKLMAGGIPVDAIIGIAPVNRTLTSAPPVNVPKRLAFYPDGAAIVNSPADTDGTVLTGVGHYDLPTHPVVVAAVVAEMRAAAGRVVVADESPKYIPLLDDPAPLPAYMPDGPPRESSPLVRKQLPVGELTGRPK